MPTEPQGSDLPIPPPNGCRWCGVEARDHLQRWKESVGWHQWVEPTSEQRKERMRARRRQTKPNDAVNGAVVSLLVP
ncbi:hypothetical protein Ssi03_19660 [Sphaerisporangium siamense]|nr:hypothetical protein Ssi03_19660 [Sphaerisporangium siamense]